MGQKQKRTPAQEKRRLYLLIVFSLVVLVLAFIAYNFAINQQRQMIEDMLAPVLLTQNPTNTPQPTDDDSVTAVPTLGYRCRFQWAYGAVKSEDVSKIRTALDSAGYADAKLETKANGEDETCLVGDEVVSFKFLMMNFTPTVIFDVDSATLYNKSAIAGMVREVAPVILAIEDLPTIGQIEVGFLNLGEEYLLWSASPWDITTALDNEIDDEALYELGMRNN